ncbi:hypothetical protein ACFE04_009447 [Oxalis oulophora]
MSRSCRRSPSLSLSRSIGRVNIRSPSVRCKPVLSPEEADLSMEFLKENDQGSEHGFGGSNIAGNKVMVVVDAKLDFKGALEWALSHTVQSQDTIVLLHVAKPKPPRKGAEATWKRRNVRACNMLQSMKNICQLRRPGVQVEVSMIEGGNEKGSIIVEEAKQQNVSLLVLGQRKKPFFWRLRKLFIFRKKKNNKNNNNSSTREEEFVNYCIQNSSCMTIGVRRKGNKVGGGGGVGAGGYLITTKRHKKFWLLA